MKYSPLFLMFIIIALGCKSESDDLSTAQSVIDKAIEASGKAKLKHAKLSFDFRGYSYQSLGDCDRFSLKRIENTSKAKIVDTYLTDGRFSRLENDSLTQVADTTATKISEAINSVHYFVQLPYRLNDKAVQKTYLGLDTIDKKLYHNIKVSFKQEGGGTDFQDVYLYWFEKNDYKLDYLAYSFVVNGGGIRFREAYNERIIEGIRFVDYKNYKPKSKDIKLENISKAFKNRELELLSKIENKNIRLEVLDKKC